MIPAVHHNSLRVRLILYTLLLFASWNFNLFRIPSGVIWYQTEPRTGYFGSDSYLVLNRLAYGERGGSNWSPLVVDCEKEQFYTSQFGLQGIVLSGLQSALGVAPGRFAIVAAAAFCFSTAFVFAAVFAVGGRRFGPLVGDVAAVLATPSPIMLQFAPSLYWATFLLAGPFALIWIFGDRVSGSARGWRWLQVAFGTVVFAKCLCGYEYVTTVVGGGVAALWYHQHIAGVPIVRRWRAAVALIAGGLVGFGLAVACHLAQLEFAVGIDAVETVRGRAEARTVGDWRMEFRREFPADRFPFLSERFAYPAYCFVDYFRQASVASPAGWSRKFTRRLPLWGLVLGALASAIAIRRQRPASGLLGSGFLALAAGASWQLIAINHMCTQSNLNLIVYHLGFVPLALLAIGCAVSAACRRDGIRKAVSAALAIGAIVAAVYSLRTADRRSPETSDADRAIEEFIQSQSLGGSTLGPSPVQCRVSGIGDESSLHPSLLVEFGWVPKTAPEGLSEPVVFLEGWAIDFSEAGEYRTPRIVVAVNGRVVPAWVARYGRPDLDRVAGRSAPGSAFLIAISKRLLPDGTKPSVFAISAHDPRHFTPASSP